MTQSCKISLASKTKQRQLYYAVLLCSDINRNKKGVLPIWIAKSNVSSVGPSSE